MQLLSNQESGPILSRFPNIELSYETISHKKVSSAYNVAFAIPHGKKYFAWFSYYKQNDVLYITELNKEKKIVKTQIHSDFVLEQSIFLGTVFYGVLLENNIFIIEDLLYYCGDSMKNMTLGEKLYRIHEFLNVFGTNPHTLEPSAFEQSSTETHKASSSPASGSVLYEKTNSLIKFLLPAIWESVGGGEPSFLDIKNLPYIVHHIQYRSLNEIVPLLNFPIKHTTEIATTSASSSEKNILDTIKPMNSPPIYNKPQYKQSTIFIVSPDIQFDIYHLCVYGKNKSLVYYDIAYIPNYKTSVFMNKLFRNIRENENLDYIEESDDESDFQNTATDKYVDLQKFLYMECVFNRKFKRWEPVRVVKPPCKVVHVSQL